MAIESLNIVKCDGCDWRAPERAVWPFEDEWDVKDWIDGKDYPIEGREPFSKFFQKVAGKVYCVRCLDRMIALTRKLHT